MAGLMGERASSAGELANDGRQILTGERAYDAAIDQVIEAACNTLHIFDFDLAQGGYGSLKRYEALNAFLRKSAQNRLVIVLHDTTHVTAYCPRLMSLLRMHSHAMSISQTSERVHRANDPFVVADATHFVHRFHRLHARAVLVLNDASEALQLEGRFDELLEASHPAVFATTLGL